MNRDSTLEDYIQRLLRVLEHIQHNLDTAMTAADLAEIASFSPFHFQRIFRSLVGESVMGHIRRLRLERSAQKLKHGNDLITQIAFTAGYEQHESFTRAFGSHFGCSPTEYRQRHRPIHFPVAPTNVHYGTGFSEFRPAVQTGAPIGAEMLTRPAVQVAYVHHVGPYDQCGAAWEQLFGWIATEGFMASAGEMVGLCHDDPDVTEDGRIRYDACVALTVGFEPSGRIGRKQIRGGDYVRVRHTGPYAGLQEVYRHRRAIWCKLSSRSRKTIITSASRSRFQSAPVTSCAPFRPNRCGTYYWRSRSFAAAILRRFWNC